MEPTANQVKEAKKAHEEYLSALHALEVEQEEAVSQLAETLTQEELAAIRSGLASVAEPTIPASQPNSQQ